MKNITKSKITYKYDKKIMMWEKWAAAFVKLENWNTFSKKKCFGGNLL